MRQIVLDTETTGLSPKLGDRIIEIACIELVDRKRTGRHFHHYMNPERGSHPGALRVHGISAEFLMDKPKFVDVGGSFMEFIQGAEVVIHNASFDVPFINNELALAGLSTLDSCGASVYDTLILAKRKHPGERNSLDALCERYGISNTQRKLHGALLDADLLADLYLAMTEEKMIA
jgi:DNA polymerase-3 subunit epsilon